MSDEKRLLVSFSGGETSAYMTQWVLKNWKNKYDKIIVVFANTGQENEQTLEFVHYCDFFFGFKTVWIEGKQYHQQRQTSGFKIVNFETASRKGEPFEDMIRKYGIPNQKYMHCTRNLKQEPIEAYARSIGWGKNSYDIAIGIRADEGDRMSITAKKRRIVYPLLKEHPMTKPKINSWWATQPFRLELKGYQGNCKWCWKKSFRKHFTLISNNPEYYDFPKRMEENYSKIGFEFSKPFDPNYHRTFFRGSMSTINLFEQYELKKDTFVPADDDAIIFDEELDVGAGCEESCEVFSDDNEIKPEIIGLFD